MIRVGIIDYDCGNLFSVQQAIKKVGAEAFFCKTPEEATKADRLILPGVGAFGDAVSKITKHGLSDAILSVADAGRPILGICLGMQLLVEKSEELGEHAGLGLIPGHIVHLPVEEQAAKSRDKTPNIGWSRLNTVSGGNTWGGTILNELTDGDFAYFVHSYHLASDYPETILATQTFGNINSPAVISKDNINGCQFHPERSGEVGLKILASWLNQ